MDSCHMKKILTLMAICCIATACVRTDNAIP